MKRNKNLGSWVTGGLALLMIALPLPALAQPQGVLFVKQNKVSIGTATPTSTLDIFSSDGSARMKIRDQSGAAGAKTMIDLKAKTGDPKFLFRSNDGATTWSLSPAGNIFVFNEINNPGVEYSVHKNGNATLKGTLTQGSSREVKSDFAAVDRSEILAKVVELPLSEWSYVGAPGERHLGPMAEDFWSSFGLGSDDKHLAPADSAGIALAAIQGLHGMLQERDAKIAELEREIAEIRALVANR